MGLQNTVSSQSEKVEFFFGLHDNMISIGKPAMFGWITTGLAC
jgi:hypothetical protein